MGAFGTAVFSDDLAMDLRDDYRDLIGDGLDGPEATDRLLVEYSHSVKDPDESVVFWLALAATQWRCGRLEERVKRRAIGVIDDGSDLHRWQADPKLLKRRQQVLERLRAQLKRPQPEKKRIRKRFRDYCEWPVGQILVYRLRSGRLTLLRVVLLHTDKGGTSPVCELLDWVGDEPPSASTIRELRTKECIGEGEWRLSRFMLGATGPREKKRAEARVSPLELVLPTQEIGRFVVFGGWRSFDDYLAKNFNLE